MKKDFENWITIHGDREQIVKLLNTVLRNVGSNQNVNTTDGNDKIESVINSLNSKEVSVFDLIYRDADGNSFIQKCLDKNEKDNYTDNIETIAFKEILGLVSLSFFVNKSRETDEILDKDIWEYIFENYSLMEVSIYNIEGDERLQGVFKGATIISRLKGKAECISNPQNEMIRNF